jgi:hypothetical protein
MKVKTEKSENRKALPKFFLTMLGSLLAGGFLGFLVGFSRILGPDTGEIGRWLDGTLRAATPWGIPVTSALTMGACFLLYRSAAKKFAFWDGGDENAASESIDILLSWMLLLSAVQLLINLFFMTAIAAYHLEDAVLLDIGVFLLSCACVIFAQQKAVDLERRMNPEKHGSVYDAKFQKKWLDSCDESERRQIGEASRRAYMATTRACLGIWLVLTVLGMVFEIGMLPVTVLLLVWGLMQVTYTLECIRLSKNGMAAQ